ncbi:MAG: ATPase, partial [Bacteroidota bacterium]
GFMRQAPERDRYLYTKQQVLDQIAICLGGALAEELVYGDRSTGAANDFQQAADLAKQVVVTGLSDLGIVTEEIAGPERLRQTVAEILRGEEERVRTLLGGKKERIERAARRLAEEERLAGDEFRSLLAS